MKSSARTPVPALLTPPQEAARPEDLALLGLVVSRLAFPEELVGGASFPGRHGLLAIHLPGNIGLGSRRGRIPGSALLLGRALHAGRLQLRLLGLRLLGLRLAGLGAGRTTTRRLYELYPLGVSTALCAYCLHTTGLLRGGLVAGFIQPAGLGRFARGGDGLEVEALAQ